MNCLKQEVEGKCYQIKFLDGVNITCEVTDDAQGGGGGGAEKCERYFSPFNFLKKLRNSKFHIFELLQYSFVITKIVFCWWNEVSLPGSHFFGKILG